MTADATPLAALHARAFVVPRPWTVAEFAALLGDHGVGVLVEPPGGFTPRPPVEAPGGFTPRPPVEALGGFTPRPPGEARGGSTPPGPPVGYFQTENEAVAGVCSEGLAGFVVFRVVLDEAELLTVAVEPVLQGQGIGGRLVARFLAAAAARGAGRAFLEVAADNAAARAVYRRAGFAEVGRRRGYYVTQGQGRVDAIVMARDLPGF